MKINFFKDFYEVFHALKLNYLDILIITSIPTLLYLLKSLGFFLAYLAHLFQHLTRSILDCNIFYL